MTPAAVWLVTAALALAGAAGVFLPGIPGAPLILLAGVFAKVMLPGALSWWTVGVLAALTVLAEGVQVVLTLGGARRMGATRWGMAGACLGALLGLWGGLLGLFAGAFAGALAAEAVFAGRPLDESARAAVGAGLGLAASLAGRVVIALTMMAVLLGAALF